VGQKGLIFEFIHMSHLRAWLHRFRLCNKFSMVAFVGVTLTATAHSIDSPLQAGPTAIILMGEIHDNSHGHTLRLHHVMALISQGHRPVVAMEQIDRENQAVLDNALVRCEDVNCVLDAAATAGWEWRFYKPFVQLALDKKITLIAANLSNADVRKVMSNGFKAVFSPETINSYNLNQIQPQLLNAQNKAIQEGHCNMLPAQAIGPMVQGQIARDVWMASVVNGVTNQMVVLIAGNGHVRKDAGVYQWLSPDKQGLTQVHGVVERADTNDANWFDHVVTVPEVEREDPCRVFTQKPGKK
jgi:uncharacterized iron-regulated protein